jgi:phosphoglycolate phosphatase
MRPTHLFLDLDGTITDPREGIVSSIVFALTRLGRPIPESETLTRFIGPPLGRVFESLLGSDDAALIQSAVAAYRERFGTIGIFENNLYPGMLDALESLVDRGLKLYVVTSKPAVYAERIVQHFELSGYFLRVYGPALDDFHGSKGTLIRKALLAEDLDPNSVIFIGDRAEDVTGAKENGMRSVGVTWGYGSREDLKASDLVVNSPSELVLSVLALGA